MAELSNVPILLFSGLLVILVVQSDLTAPSMSVDSKKPDHPVNLTPAFNHDTSSKYFPMPSLDAGMPKEEKLAK